MLSRVKTIARGLALSALAAIAVSGPALADKRDRTFFEGVQGEWSGPGEFLNTKLRGTKFTCKLSGSSMAEDTGMALDGFCRAAIFKQKMNAFIKNAGRGYKGQFLDGAKGEGLDIVSGDVIGEKVVMGLHRGKIEGAMLLRMHGKNRMTVTISVKDNAGEWVKVIGIDLQRQSEEIAVGSVN